MRNFEDKMHRFDLARALSQTPRSNVLPRPLTGFKGPASKGRKRKRRLCRNFLRIYSILETR